LIHPEHHTIVVDIGDYQVLNEREYDPFKREIERFPEATDIKKKSKPSSACVR
jgi:hypothetical protein